MHFIARVHSSSLLAAPSDVLAPERGSAERRGSSEPPFLSGSEQKAMESTDVPGCGSREHSTQRHTEPGEGRHLIVMWGLADGEEV